MRGDFSRVTFRPEKHYSGVRLQQARAYIEAEFNEHGDIEAYRDEQTTRDVIGRFGTPYDGGGFRIEVAWSPRDVSFSGTDGFAVGEDSLVLRSTGGGDWTLEPTLIGAGRLNAVHATAANAALAVGQGGRILTWNGSAWSGETSGTAVELFGVHVDGANAWAVGAAGTIRFRSGATWAGQSPPEGVTATLRAVHVLGPDGWIVGEGATILRTSDRGGSWSRVQPPAGTGNLYALFAVDAQHVWAVGDGGSILFWNGTAWTRQSSGVSVRLRSVRFSDAQSGTAVGEGATIVATANGGASWTVQPSPAGVTADLYGVDISGGTAYAVGAGTAIVRPSGQQWQVASPRLQANAGRSLSISGGDMYVEGVRVENERAVTLTAQPDLRFTLPPGTTPPVFPPADAPGRFGVYLRLIEQHLTALEREELREVALGGPDTATRTRTVWQVKLTKLAQNASCADFGNAVLPPAQVEPSSEGRLRARAEPGQLAATECDVPLNGGFRRLENQLYRVEVHESGTAAPAPPPPAPPAGTATFKWSRDNGMVATRLLAVDSATRTVTVADPGKDALLSFAPEQWIELSDESRELRGEPGVLLQIHAVDGNELEIKAASMPAQPLSMSQFPVNPTVRRWEGTGFVSTGSWLSLEDGVEVQFAGGPFRTGDHWFIPARSTTGTVEWPRTSGISQFQPPAGPRVRFAPLAVADVDANGVWSQVQDCRRRFPPLTGLIHFYYAGGDGQEVAPDPLPPTGQQFPLPQPLEVGVSNWYWPVAGARVKFKLVPGTGSGQLSGSGQTGSEITVTTGSDGIASCSWSLDETTQSQRVEAYLLDDNGVPVQTPIRFSAGLSRATHVAYDPTGCKNLSNAGAITVQKAVQHLAARARLTTIAGDAQEVLPGEALDPIRLRAENDCGPIAGAQVRLSASDGGTLKGPSQSGAQITESTDGNGQLSVTWTLGATGQVQYVEALLVHDGTAAPPPPAPVVVFSANLSRANRVSFDPPPNCKLLDGRDTVQTAIEALAAGIPRLYHVSGDGLEASPGETIALRVGIANQCSIKTPLVRFEIFEGENGWEALEEVPPDDDGIATHDYTVGEDERQRLRAWLLVDSEKPIGYPVYFNVSVVTGGQGTIPSVRLRRFNAQQPTQAARGTPVIFNDESVEFDTGRMFEPGVDPTRLVARRAGAYLIVGEIAWDKTSGAGYRSVLIEKQGNQIAQVGGPALPTGVYTTQQVTALTRMNAGEHAQLVGLQGSGGALNIFGAQFSMAWLGP